MSLREITMQSYPEFPWLVAGDVARVEALLSRLHWLRAGEIVQSCDRAGAGNVNLVLRVQTGERSFVRRQARAWVSR